jgi:hypothetical protein
MPAILMCTIWWPTFDNTDSPLFLLSAQCLNTESIMKGVLCQFCVQTVRFFEKHAQNLNTPQNNSASWNLKMGFNWAFNGLRKWLGDLQMLLWHVTVTTCYCDHMLLWPNVAVTTCYCDHMLLWPNVTVTTCCCDQMLLWPHVTVTKCYCDHMLLWPNVTVTKCYCDHMLLWPNVTVTKCYCDHMLLWPHVTVTTT